MIINSAKKRSLAADESASIRRQITKDLVAKAVNKLEFGRQSMRTNEFFNNGNAKKEPNSNNQSPAKREDSTL